MTDILSDQYNGRPAPCHECVHRVICGRADLGLAGRLDNRAAREPAAVALRLLRHPPLEQKVTAWTCFAA